MIGTPARNVTIPKKQKEEPLFVSGKQALTQLQQLP